MARPLIALFLRTLANDYQELLREDCLSTAARRGFAVRVFAADNDAEKQARQIRECLQDQESLRPTVVMVSPVRETTLLVSAYEAARAGVGWVVLNRSSEYLSELRRAFPEVALFSVNPDQLQVGRIQGQQIKTLLGDGGELLYIQGPLLTSSAQKRLTGMQQVLGKTAIKMVTFSADWSVQGGEQAARNWVQLFRYRDVPNCLVAAQNDSMAMGARRALIDEAAERKRPEIALIRVSGCDGSPSYGQKLVNQRQLAATVIIPPVSGRAVEELSLVVESHRMPAPEVVIDVTPYPELTLLEAIAKQR